MKNDWIAAAATTVVPGELVWLTTLTLAFSPSRGRIVSNVLANPRLASARWLSNGINIASGCSLSPGERVRVRASVEQKTSHKFYD